jgi:flagellar motility protein MotE (MotC chaperone)
LKNTIVYAVIFILAFAGTTIGVYTFNNKYANIFHFDFRDAAEVALADSLTAIVSDSLAVSDSTLVTDLQPEENEKKLEEDYAETKVELDKTSNQLSKKEKELEHLKTQLEEKKTAEHEEWLKSTIKLYEAMQTNKAGELLSALPEKEARELIYAMKNKKAAAILSSLDIETVKRLTRAKK